MRHRDAILPPRRRKAEGPENVTAQVVEPAEPSDWGQRGKAEMLRPPAPRHAQPARLPERLRGEEVLARVVVWQRAWSEEHVEAPRISSLLSATDTDPIIVLADALYPNDVDRLQDGVLYVRLQSASNERNALRT